MLSRACLVQAKLPEPGPNPGLWGATLGGGAYVARSAIGQDAGGDLMYAASMSTVPADLDGPAARCSA